MRPGVPQNTQIRPQSAPAGPASASGNVMHTVGQTQRALQQNPNMRPPKQKKRSSQHIPQQPASRGPRIKVGLALYVQLVLAGVAAGTASLAYLRYFSTLGFLISTLPAAALGVLVGAFTSVRRWKLLPSLGAAAVGFLLIAIFAVERGTLSHGVPSWTTIKALGTGLVSGWTKMLSVSLPADPAGELEFVPALITWAAAAGSATLILRYKSLLAPVLLPVLAFLIALPFTAPRPVGGMILIGVLLGEVLLLTLVRAGVADPLQRQVADKATLSRFLFGLPVVVVAVAAGLAGMKFIPLADGTDRFDLRTIVPPELRIDDTISPLSTLKSQLKKPDNSLFTVKLSGDTTGIDRVRTATLDRYDGAMWSSGDKFMVSGRSLAPDESLVNPRRVTMNVSISGLQGPYLPEIGAPVELTPAPNTLPRFGFSEDSGTLATNETLSGVSYDLVAEVGRQAGLDKSVPYVTSNSEMTKLPDDPPVPDAIRTKAEQLVGNVSEPYAKLLAIQKYMQSFPYNLETRPGHSYDALSRLFGANLTEQVGYAEQFAAAFVVLARQQGFPARVAVGYLLNKDHKKGDAYEVKSGDAHAWAEVDLAGYGWVAFEPTDPQRHPANAPKKQETETPADNNKPEQTTTASQPAEDPNLPRLAGAKMTLLDWAIYVLIGLGALLLLTPIGIAIEKFRRRRARHTGSRAARIVGAWQQATDRLIEHGVPVTASSTTSEVTTQAQERIGSEGTGSLAVLAPIVTAAMYNPEEPSDTAVQEAWQLEAQLRRELRKVRSTFWTLRAWLDPRPLFARWRDERRRRKDMDRLTRG
ncbi:transglutaminaseTgpA domain-containing protein [Actinocrispum sp. NPDC049592]|uniref:transglutaminase family protein n=1 Tax=Actinocrispum sp. NPDC049592 TaxID=3154835 RepID=UPI00343EFD04